MPYHTLFSVGVLNRHIILGLIDVAVCNIPSSKNRVWLSFTVHIQKYTGVLGVTVTVPAHIVNSRQKLFQCNYHF